MKLAANLSLLYSELPLKARMAAAARDGFRGVEILFPYDSDASALASQLHDHGLELILTNTPLGANGEKGLACLPGRRADFRDGFHKALDICMATGCKIIHVMAGEPPADTDRAACFDTLIENLRLAAPLAAQSGITLSLEALNRHDVPGYFYHLPEQVTEVVRAVNHPSVRLQFDFYHTQREGMDLDAQLRRALPLVRHVQFASPVNRREPRLDDPEVATALCTLRDTGYDGWIGCEYIPQGDTSTGLAWREAYYALIAHDKGKP